MICPNDDTDYNDNDHSNGDDDDTINTLDLSFYLYTHTCIPGIVILEVTERSDDSLETILQEHPAP